MIFDASADVLALIPPATAPLTGTVSEWDMPVNVERAKQLIGYFTASGHVSIMGVGGNNTAFSVAAALVAQGVSRAVVLSLMSGEWNAACKPPWGLHELKTIIDHAFQYGQEREGGSALENPEKVFTDYQKPNEPGKRQRYLPLTEPEARAFYKPVEWLARDWLPAKGVGLLYGRRSSFKSFLALDMALSLSTGLPGFWGFWPTPRPVLYLMGEGPDELIHERVAAWRQHTGKTHDGAITYVPGVPSVADGEGWKTIRDNIVPPSLIVIDTFSKLIAGLDEQSSRDMRLATNFALEMADFYNCFVLLIGHEGKTEGRGMRGALTIEDDVDTILKVERVKGDAECVNLFVTKQRGGRYDDQKAFRLDVKRIDVGAYRPSLVLVPGEVAPEPKGKSDYLHWTAETYLEREVLRLGGEVNDKVLADEIAEKEGLDAREVIKILSRLKSPMKEGYRWRAEL